MRMNHPKRPNTALESRPLGARGRLNHPAGTVYPAPPGHIEAIVRAKGPKRLPVVLTRREVAALMGRLSGVRRLMALLLYGSGLRLNECLCLRVKEVDLEIGQLTVRSTTRPSPRAAGGGCWHLAGDEQTATADSLDGPLTRRYLVTPDCTSDTDRRSTAWSAFMTLETKLAASFLRYDKAIRHLRRNYDGFAGRLPLSRDDLNDYLDVNGTLSLNRGELKALKKLQDKAVKKQRQRNEADSKLDLATLRLETALEQRKFAEEVPKGALLHVHPGGTRSKKTVENILTAMNPTINVENVIKEEGEGGKRGSHQSLTSEDKAQFSKIAVNKDYNDCTTAEKELYVAIFFLDPDKRYPFSRFDTLFLIDDVFGKPESATSLTTTYDDFAAQCHRLNVSYVEFTDGLEIDNDTVFDEHIKALETAADNWKTKVTLRWNMAFKRFRSDTTNVENFDKFKARLSTRPTVVVNGIDLLASERNFPALTQAQNLYLKANEAQYDLSQTMHAGELCRDIDRNPRDAILLGAERIGHGVTLKRDRLTMEYNRGIARVGVVANVISNQILRAHEEIATHPFLYYLRLGIPTSLSTDNPGIFQTNIANDYYHVITETDINYSELKQLAYYGINMGFADPPKKAALLNDLDARFKKFEQKWVKRASVGRSPN